MRAATGNQCNFVRRGVTCALNSRGLTEPGEHYNSPVWIEQVLGQRDSVRKGLILLMLCKANLQDRAVLAMWSVNFSWSSITTPRFLANLDGVMDDEPSWMEKLWWSVGLAGITSRLALSSHSFTNVCRSSLHV